MRLSSHEVLGIGAPLIDYLLQVDESFIHQILGKKGGMVPVDYQTCVGLIESSQSVPVMRAGGSAANAIKGLAALGRRCAFMGKVGKDGLGEELWEELQNLNITPYFHYSDTPTGRVVCLITPDGKRTCRTFLGASQELYGKELNASLFQGVRLVHIEGYTLLANNELAERAVKIAREHGATVSFDLGSFEVVEKHREKIERLLPHINLLFANEDEAAVFTNKTSQQACWQLQEVCEIAVVMMAEQGCWVGSQGRTMHCPAFAVKPLDTTGAGDLFASGFLHGWLSKKPLLECARWGALAARAIVQVVGAELTAKQWEGVVQMMQNPSSILDF